MLLFQPESFWLKYSPAKFLNPKLYKENRILKQGLTLPAIDCFCVPPIIKVYEKSVYVSRNRNPGLGAGVL